MIATDTNILVYAHRSDSEWHGRARARVESLALGRVSWGLPWPCIHEFLAVVSHPGIFDPPSSIDAAIDQRAMGESISNKPGAARCPGVLVLNSDGQLLYRWRSVPSRANAGSAAGRPTAEYVWGEVRHALAQQSGEDAPLDEAPMLDSRPVIFPLFAAVLMANGWFMRPRLTSK